MTGMVGVLWPQLRKLFHPSAFGDVAIGASRLGRLIPKFDIAILSREGRKANLGKCAIGFEASWFAGRDPLCVLLKRWLELKPSMTTHKTSEAL